MRVVVVGGTGYTGQHVVQEAVARGHEVVSISRSAPAEPVPGATYEHGPVEELAPRLVPGADAVVATLSPRGDTAGRLVEVYGTLARLSAETGARFVQVGGFSSLRPEAGAPRFVEGEVPEAYRAEAQEGEATRAALVESAPDGLDWVFVSPAATYGAFAPGERTGAYRLSDEVALLDAEGGSTLSGADFGIALVDLVEDRSRSRAHVGVAQ